MVPILGQAAVLVNLGIGGYRLLKVADFANKAYDLILTPEGQQRIAQHLKDHNIDVNAKSGEELIAIGVQLGLTQTAATVAHKNKVLKNVIKVNSKKAAKANKKGEAGESNPVTSGGKADSISGANLSKDLRSQADGRGFKLDWTRHSHRTGGDAAHHVLENHGSLKLTKKDQGVFYSNPVKSVEEAWQKVQLNGIQPSRIKGGDVYVVPRPNSGYSGGYSGQRQNLDHVTIIVDPNSHQVITAFPSGGTPSLIGYFDVK